MRIRLTVSETSSNNTSILRFPPTLAAEVCRRDWTGIAVFTSSWSRTPPRPMLPMKSFTPFPLSLAANAANSALDWSCGQQAERRVRAAH